MEDGVSMATGRRALVEYVEWESNIATEPVQILNLWVAGQIVQVNLLRRCRVSLEHVHNQDAPVSQSNLISVSNFCV